MRAEMLPRARNESRLRQLGALVTRRKVAWAKLRYRAGEITLRGHGFVCIGIVASLLVTGFFPTLVELGWRQFVVLALLAGLLAHRLGSHLHHVSRGVTEEVPVWRDLELGLFLILACAILLRVTGGLSSPFAPLLYALVAFLVAFQGLRIGGALVAFALLLEAGQFVLPTGTISTGSPSLVLAARLTFIILFAGLSALFLTAEVVWRRRRAGREVRTTIDTILEQAREYRLISSTLGAESVQIAAADRARRRAISSVRAIEDSARSVLQMVVDALDPYTCVLLLLDTSGEKLKIRELISKSDLIAENPLPAGKGVIGGIIKQRQPISLSNLGPDYGRISYYLPGEKVGAFLGVPLMEGDFVRGVLCIDRRDRRPFGEREQRVLDSVAAEILRFIQMERIYSEMDQEKSEKEMFFQASQELNRALDLAQVYGVVMESTRRVVAYDLAAITLYNDKHREHVIVRAGGRLAAPSLTGARFRDNSGLVASCVKTGHPLPFVPFHLQDRSHQMIFDSELPVKGLRSLKVYPLRVKEKTIGTFVIGAAEESFFSRDQEKMLGVIADHAAISMDNARMYDEMKRRAITDGLTGLNNHRRFQELLEEAYTRAVRYQKKLSLCLIDLDHFKGINDTYGHTVGDMVLRRMAAVLGKEARATDSVARYGGEEFAIIMEETDREGCKKMAERVRQAVARQPFVCGIGSFSVTLSVGCATHPDDSSSKEDLIEKADAALYWAKEHGRNRSAGHHEI